MLIPLKTTVIVFLKLLEKSENLAEKANHSVLRNSPDRFKIVDILRGFALFGILLIHSLQKFSNTTNSLLGESGPEADIIKGSIEFLVEDKFYILFSFLFGWSFYTMYHNSVKRRKPFVKIYSWRLVTLLIIGLIHSLFYGADILQIYAFIGIVLVICRDFKSKNLLILSLILAVLSVPCIFYQHQLLETIIKIKQAGLLVPTKLTYNILTGRLFTTGAMFIFGLYAGRMNFLEDLSKDHLLQNLVVFRSMYIFVIISLCLTLIKFYFIPSENDAVRICQVICFVVQNFSLSCLYVILIIMLYSRTLFSRPLEYLIALGRIGMSGYLMQSVFLLVLYNLKAGSETDLSEAITITILFYFGQIFFAHIWLSYFKFGPVEWLWRKLTLFGANL